MASVSNDRRTTTGTRRDKALKNAQALSAVEGEPIWVRRVGYRWVLSRAPRGYYDSTEICVNAKSERGMASGREMRALT
jgi:hypothetical protein